MHGRELFATNASLFLMNTPCPSVRLCASFAPLFVRAPVAMTKPNDAVLANATVIDGKSSEPQPGIHVIVRRGRIEAVTSDRLRPDKSGGRTTDLEGRFLLPGLIDAHLHIYNLASARTALRSGVTTARSMKVPHFADVGIRNLLPAVQKREASVSYEAGLSQS